MKSDKNEILRKNLLLYAVTDRHWTGEKNLIQQTEEAIRGGATFVQIREKNLDEQEFEQEAIQLKKLCEKYKIPFVVNDNVQLAKKIDADGVHIGQEDMNPTEARKILGEQKIIGVSAQTVEEALLAEKQGADYLGVGAVFHTGSKDDAIEVPPETLKSICKAVKIPVVAIGGITKDNVSELKNSGICGISVISAIFAQKDIISATKDLKERVEKILG
ncbi:MAG: thiamine phosphate synthase [Treponema sp.]|nr:thiamine phosphate synthase [Treponema sp.]